MKNTSSQLMETTLIQEDELSKEEQNKLYEEMFNLSKYGERPDRIIELLNKGVNPNNLEVEKKHRGASVISNIIRRSENEKTALDLLKFIHERDITKSLIKTKVQDVVLGPPLIYSAISNYDEDKFELASFLLDEIGIKVDSRGMRSLTALYIVAAGLDGNHPYPDEYIKKKVEFLISKGANPLIKDAKGHCLYDLVNSEVIREIMRNSLKWGENVKQYEFEMAGSLRKRDSSVAPAFALIKNENLGKNNDSNYGSYFLEVIGAYIPHQLNFFSSSKKSNQGYRQVLQIDDIEDETTKIGRSSSSLKKNS